MGVKIELANVDFAYEKGNNIVKSASFSVCPGEILAIVAPVGMGKSTLLKLCAGLLTPVEGSLLIDGKIFGDLSMNWQNELRHRMGFSFQEAVLVANMTVFNNLALPLRYYAEMTEAEISHIINAWLERLNLAPIGNSLPAALSLGVRQKVAFIRTMLLGRDFFFWDEPAQNADPAFTEMVQEEILKQKRSGVGQILATQNRDLLFKSADRVLMLDGGTISYLGPLKSAGIGVDFRGTGQYL
ncbi:MAG TPA: hypothetical protein DCL44_05800 [Elusimicrobia bacterium]|nr:hypothetical protein [Elusimicrobiota bacterium]